MRIGLYAAVLSTAACSFGSTGASGSASAGSPGDDGTAAGLDTGDTATAATLSATHGAASSDGDGSGAGPGTSTAMASEGTAEPPTSTGDDASSTGGDDTGTTGEPALPVGPFEPPVPISELNSDSADDDDPSVTADELFIVFNSARSGVSEIWWSSRESIIDVWDPPQPLEAFSEGYITGPSVTPDGLVLLWSTNVAPSAGLDVWMATRDDREASWGPAQRVEGLSSATTDIAPRWFPALGVAWLCSDRAGSVGETDPWIAPWSPGDLAPGVAAHVPELATAFADCAVGLSADGREAFVESTRPGDAGSWDLWRVHRDDPSLPFLADELQPATELNTSGFDIDPWPSADGHRLYMASDRDGGLDLWVASRDE